MCMCEWDSGVKGPLVFIYCNTTERAHVVRHVLDHWRAQRREIGDNSEYGCGVMV